MIKAYTDGSYKSSINCGGYGAIIKRDEEVIAKLYQGYRNTTNNRMEIQGVLAVLRYFKEPTEINIVSDSMYVISSITQGHAQRWFDEKDLTKKNLDLWKEMLELYNFHKVTFN